MKDNLAQVAVIYRRVDGMILRVSSIPAKLIGKVTEDDIHMYMPNVDELDEYAMVFVQGRQYLDIDKYKVELDINREFVDIIEKADILSTFQEDYEINTGLLEREADIVVSVLSIIDDRDRLAKYKAAEERGLNRPEVISFFREKGV